MKKYLFIYMYNVNYYSTDYIFANCPPNIKDIRKAELEIQKENNYESSPLIVNFIEISK